MDFLIGAWRDVACRKNVIMLGKESLDVRKSVLSGQLFILLQQLRVVVVRGDDVEAPVLCVDPLKEMRVQIGLVEHAIYEPNLPSNLASQVVTTLWVESLLEHGQL